MPAGAQGSIKPGFEMGDSGFGGAAIRDSFRGAVSLVTPVSRLGLLLQSLMGFAVEKLSSKW